jgi:hypothetical protein
VAPDQATTTPPCSQPTVVLTKQASIARTWDAHDGRAQQARLGERDAAWKRAVDTLQAMLRARTPRRYGTQSAPASGADGTTSPQADSPTNRGQPPGSQGQGRRDRGAWPVVAEGHDGSAEAPRCPPGGDAWVPFPGPEASDRIAVEGQAHRRRLQRPRSRQGGAGPQGAGRSTAPPAPRLLPTSPCGVAGGTQGWRAPDRAGRPTPRFCEALHQHGLPLAPGPRTAGRPTMAARGEPLMPLCRARHRGAKRFQGDATRWHVCAAVAGNTGDRWELWGRHAAAGVGDRLAPGRGAEGPHGQGDTLPRDLGDVVLGWDRSRASPRCATRVDELMVASGGAQGRRAVLRAARRWPAREEWRGSGVNARGTLAPRHGARLPAWDDAWPLAPHPVACVACHAERTSHLGQRQGRGEASRKAPALHGATRTGLRSLPHHWEGLPVFVERPAVAMDHQTADRARRHPVGGRQHAEGSGRVWSAPRAAMRGSVRHPLWRWGRPPPPWRRAFWPAWADHGGKSPEDLRACLPWQRTPERRAELTRPVPPTWTPRGDPEAPDTSEPLA